MGLMIPNPHYIAAKANAELKQEKRERVMRLVEAQIKASFVDLSPEEMIDAAFLIDEKINEKIYGVEGKE